MTDKQRRKIVLEAKIQIIDAINLGSPTSIFECIIEEAIQKAIDYSLCCKSDSELLDADFGFIVGKEAHFYKDGEIIRKEKLKFSD